MTGEDPKQHPFQYTSEETAGDKIADDTVDDIVDDITDLYIGRIVTIRSALQTDQGPAELDLRGEVLLYAQEEGTGLHVKGIRRVALYGALPNPAQDPRIGVLSLWGPVNETNLEPGSQGRLENMLLQLHYQALPESDVVQDEYDTVVLPQTEQIVTSLEWYPVEKGEGEEPGLVISIRASGSVKPVLGVVQQIEVPPVEIVFERAGSGSPLPEPHRSLLSNCPPTAFQQNDPAQVTVTRRLPIRFVNLSLGVAGLVGICRDLQDAFCEIWRNKGALDLPTTRPIVQASEAHKNAYCNLTPNQETILKDLGYASPDRVQVYLVNQLDPNRGGGVVHFGGTASAFCILAMDSIAANRNLLAHELGHVLGLAHPNGTGGLIQSERGTVMDPSGSNLNPNRNTTQNIQIFTDPQLNPIVRTTPTPDYFHPDP